MTPLKLLFVQQTGWAVQEFPPTPTMLRGVQVIPTRTLGSERTMPRRPKRRLAVLEEADWTELQHRMLLVLHWLAGMGVGLGCAVTVTVVVGLAAARMVNAIKR